MLQKNHIAYVYRTSVELIVLQNQSMFYKRTYYLTNIKLNKDEHT